MCIRDRPRRTAIIQAAEEPEIEPGEEIPDYPVHLFFTKEGYFKKITPQSLRMSGEQKLKEGDAVIFEGEGTNRTEMLFFTDKCQVYKAKAADFEDGKASLLGDYVPAKLGMDEGERAIYMLATTDYAGFVLFFFRCV